MRLSSRPAGYAPPLALLAREPAQPPASTDMQRLLSRFAPISLSNYRIGVSLLYPHLKHNRFKPKLRLVQKLMGGPRNDC